MDGGAIRQLGPVAREPAREVAADRDLELLGRRGPEVRVERDQPLDLVQRPAPVARELHELRARQPAVLALDRRQRRDQRWAGELAGAGLDARDAAVALAHQPAPWSACEESGKRVGLAAGRLDAHRAELELRDLPERVDLVDREQVRRRLAEVERDEARPGRLAMRDLRGELDRSAARGDAHEVAVGDAHAGGVRLGDEDHRGGLDGVERERSPRHRAGVPVLEQAARVEHERVLLVRQLLRRHPLGGHEVRLAVVGRERLAEEHDGPVGVLRIRVGIQLARRPEVAVLEPAVGGRERDHLVEHVADRRVLHRHPDPARDLTDDLPVGACLAGRIEDLAPDLDAPVGVGVGPLLLEERRGRQDDVGELGGLGEEDVLHDEELECGERLADLVDVRVREERVLAHHVHPADAALEGAAHDLGHGQARLGVELATPRRAELLLRGRVVDALVVREHHRDQARVGRALHVVLAAERMQPAARACRRCR